MEVSMSDQTKSRFAVDLDDLERQLRQTASAQPRTTSADPLAELARIVGQDDPFKAMFTDKRAGAPPANEPSPVQARVEPRFDASMREQRAPVQAAMPEEAPTPSRPPAAGPPSDMLDEFDRLLRTEMRGSIVDSRTVSSQPHALSPEGLEPHAPAAFASQRSAADAHSGGQRELDPLPLDDPDQLARRIREDEMLPVQSREQDGGMADYPEPPAEPVADMRSLEAQQPRKGLIIASALLGVAALGIGAIVGIRGLSGPSVRSGEPPTIKAEAGPNRVAPVNPGGVDIPNQNKQIYERTPEPKSADTRIVTREEQPMDVQATTRAARVILPGPGAGSSDPSAAPAQAAPPAASLAPAASSAPPSAAPPSAAPQVAGAPAAPALGEPRRVRTVAVRPDGTIAPVNGAPANGAPVAAATAVPTAAPATTASAAPAQRPPVASPQSTTAQAPAPRPPARPAADEQAARTPPGRVQTAAAPAAQAAAPSAAAASAEPAPASGGFMIQLGAPGSEAEARAAFASLQRRFGDQLASATPTIRRAEVGNGRTVWRLRVGPYSREDAAERCQSLQAAGGQCFIARN
jgi:hypothetical protein